MAATVAINEYFSAGETKSAAIAKGHFLNIDAASTSDAVRDANPIPVPATGSNYSYEKWHKLEATGGTFTSLTDFRHYNSAAPGTGLAIETSAQSGTPSDETYNTPINTNSAKADTAMPTSDPAVKTINGTLTAATQETGYVVTQLEVQSTATAGFDLTCTWKWAETV